MHGIPNASTAFTQGWQLTLVIISLMPVLAIAGVLITFITGKLQARMTSAYGDANSISTQALANVRTVYAFNAEQEVLDSYGSKLDYPVKVSVPSHSCTYAPKFTHFLFTTNLHRLACCSL